jgi:hypothetical protein
MKGCAGIKVVWAEPMTRNEAGKAGLIINCSPNDEDCPGYKVVYEGGYKSWFPEHAFGKACRIMEEIETETQGEKCFCC